MLLIYPQHADIVRDMNSRLIHLSAGGQCSESETADTSSAETGSRLQIISFGSMANNQRPTTPTAAPVRRQLVIAK